MKKSELKEWIKKILLEDDDLGAFHQDLQSQIKGNASKIKRTDYEEGDQLYTITGAPVVFVSDTIPDRKTGKQRVIIRTKDGETMSTSLENVLPEMPSKEQFLEFIANFYGKRNDHDSFERSAMKHGYDVNDGIEEFWNNKKTTHNEQITKKTDPKNMVKLGDCRDEDLVDELFGSVTDFANLIEKYGDNFEYGNIKVLYNEKTDVHTFYKK